VGSVFSSGQGDTSLLTGLCITLGFSLIRFGIMAIKKEAHSIEYQPFGGKS